jgi:regulator of protease activity HflC (stomatin/prohibitin superfamily)
MTHRIEVNVETGEVKQVEYTPEEQAVYDAAVVAQQAAEAQAAEAAAAAEAARLAAAQPTQ